MGERQPEHITTPVFHRGQGAVQNTPLWAQTETARRRSPLRFSPLRRVNPEASRRTRTRGLFIVVKKSPEDSPKRAGFRGENRAAPMLEFAGVKAGGGSRRERSR
jgi:hypothetical protein